MGTFKNGIISIYLVLFTVLGNYSNALGCDKQLRECVKITITSQIGVREHGGANSGFSVEKYLKSTNLGKGYSWCAAFINWSLKHCNIKTKNSAWSPAWFPKSRITQSPKCGDVFGIYFKSKKRIAHVGFIYEWTANSKYCITIEGNTNSAGSREGDGVYKKRRLKSQINKVANWIDG